MPDLQPSPAPQEPEGGGATQFRRWSDPSVNVAKTYVWHDGKCFFVSTIERQSSAMAHPCRFNETMAWEYDWDAGARKEEILYMGEAMRGSLRTHQETVERIHKTGNPNEPESE